MKLFRICLCLFMVAGTATVAMGQYGLYGSPDTIKMSQPAANVAPYDSYSTTPGSYSAPASYVAQQPMQQPMQAYQAQPMQTYAAQPVQPYAAQQMQPYAAQQMQPLPARPVATYGQMGSQYRTPTYSRPMYYTAAADQSGATQPLFAQPAMPVPQMAPAGPTPPAQPVLPEPIPAPGIQQSPGVMSQMLAEQGQGAYGCATGSEGYPPYNGQCGMYQPYVNRYDQSACGNCNYGCAEPCLWYASLSALVMTRDRPNKVYITYEIGNQTHNDFPNDEFSWRWGGEVRIGRRFCCGCNPGYWAIEASYWTLDEFQSYVSHTVPGGTVGTPLQVQYNQFYFRGTSSWEQAQIWFGGGPAGGVTGEAAEHRLWRRDEVHNVEVNLVRGQWTYGCDSRWDLGWSLGIRYFRFQESWRFGSVMEDHYFGESDGRYEAYFSDLITNNLIGPQIGFDLGYNMGANLRFYLTPKFGIYNNHINNYFQAYVGSGENGRPDPTSGVTGTYPVDSSTNTVSFLTQMDVGFDWRFANQWSARAGYRVVAVSSIGLADAQIPFYTVDIPAIADIDRNGDLILHGAFLTLAYNF